MPTTPSFRRIAWALLGLAAVMWVLWAHSGLPHFNLAWLQTRQVELLAFQAASPRAFAIVLFSLFTLLSALALPGCSVLALAAGLSMGWVAGTLLVVFASTLGATISFLAARHWWRDAVRRRWGHRLVAIENGLARDGAYYLFSLRVAPVIPYALINPLMGLSAMPLRQFFVVSLLGMLAGSAVYVYAGTVLSEASSWQTLFTPGLMVALAGLALLPWVMRKVMRKVMRWLVRLLRPAKTVVTR
jgi:uncharacterized membrane protein YdjX (TVP38/TMEM64 family)